jgi:DNA gyrase subunit A
MNLGEGTTLLAVARNADEPSDVANGDAPDDAPEAPEAGEETTAPSEQ